MTTPKRQQDGSFRPTPSELKYAARLHRDTQIAQGFRTLVRGATGCFVAYCAFLSIKEVSGKSTDFRAVIDWAFKADVSKWAGWIVAGLCGGGWGFQVKRNRKLVHQAGRSAELEQAQDPGRSSSGLTRDGEAPRESGP